MGLIDSRSPTAKVTRGEALIAVMVITGMDAYVDDYSPEDFPVYDFCNTSSAGFENWEIAVTVSGCRWRKCLFIGSTSSGMPKAAAVCW